MKLYNYPDAKQVLVSGDIHGDFKLLVYNLCIRFGCTDTLLIVAGDCGFGFEKPGYYEIVYNTVADRLRKANNWVVFVRGNHDDPSYFAGEIINHTRWRTVPDYSVITAAGHSLLCIGGATSIDRIFRMKQRNRYHAKPVSCYWPDEAPVFKPEEIESIPTDIRIDTVITHTAPSFCELNMHNGFESWAQEDPSLIDDVTAERATMDRIIITSRARAIRFRSGSTDIFTSPGMASSTGYGFRCWTSWSLRKLWNSPKLVGRKFYLCGRKDENYGSDG